MSKIFNQSHYIDFLNPDKREKKKEEEGKERRARVFEQENILKAIKET